MQQVITNLLIGQIELRSEDSPDILPYSHERRVEKLVVPLGVELAAIQKAYIQVSHFYHNLGVFFFFNYLLFWLCWILLSAWAFL